MEQYYIHATIPPLYSASIMQRRDKALIQAGYDLSELQGNNQLVSTIDVIIKAPFFIESAKKYEILLAMIRSNIKHIESNAMTMYDPYIAFDLDEEAVPLPQTIALRLKPPADKDGLTTFQSSFAKDCSTYYPNWCRYGEEWSAPYCSLITNLAAATPEYVEKMHHVLARAFAEHRIDILFNSITLMKKMYGTWRQKLCIAMSDC